MNHVPKAASDRDPLPDLNYVCSHALQTPSQSRTGSAHCEVIFCSHCAVHADIPMHGISTHFQNAHARITFRKSFAFTCPQNQVSCADYDPKRQFFRISKACQSFAFTKGKLRLSNQESVRITQLRNVIPSFVNRPSETSLENCTELGKWHRRITNSSYVPMCGHYNTSC